MGGSYGESAAEWLRDVYGMDLRGWQRHALDRALAAAKEMDGPVVVHVLTQKGRGYAPAENDSVKHLHDMGSVKPGSYTGAFSEAIVAEAEARPELVALTAAMPDSTGLLPMMERFPETWPAEWLRGHTNQAHWADYWLSFTQPQEVNYAAL